MQKKLTISIDEEVYEGLHDVIGPRKISKFVEELVRPHVVRPKLVFTNYVGALPFKKVQELNKTLCIGLDIPEIF